MARSSPLTLSLGQAGCCTCDPTLIRPARFRVSPRACSQLTLICSSQPDISAYKLNHGEEVWGELFIAGSNVPKLLDTIKEALDKVAIFV